MVPLTFLTLRYVQSSESDEFDEPQASKQKYANPPAMNDHDDVEAASDTVNNDEEDLHQSTETSNSSDNVRMGDIDHDTMDIMSHTQFSSIDSDANDDIMSRSCRTKRSDTNCTHACDVLSEHDEDVYEMDDAQTIATMDDAQWILEQEFLNKADKGNDVHLSALILIEQTLISQRLKQRDLNNNNNHSRRNRSYQYVNKHINEINENEQIQQKLQQYLKNQQGFEYENFMKYLETLKRDNQNNVIIHRSNHLKTPFREKKQQRNHSNGMKVLSPFSNLSAISPRLSKRLNFHHRNIISGKHLSNNSASSYV